MDYFERMRRRIAGQEDLSPSSVGDKQGLRQFARLIGVKTPTIYARGPIAGLLTSDLPAEFVLKPAFASTSIGVMLLRREGDGYEDLLTGSRVSMEDVQAKCNDVASKYYDNPGAAVFLAEELLRSHDGETPPPDIRCYTFQGDIGLIVMEDHLAGPAAAMYFDGDFLPFADVSSRYGVAVGAERLESIVEARTPHCWREVLAVAKRVSVAVPAAFCRVDLYDTPNGVYLGEITFYPGTFYYRNRKIMSQAEAERLGRLWGQAAERLAGSVVQRATMPGNPG
jgi:hypothetical protein